MENQIHSWRNTWALHRAAGGIGRFYGLLLHNWVYVVSNVALLATAAVGQIIYRRNKRDSPAR